MNCETCNKLSCLDCVAELEKQLAQAKEALTLACDYLGEIETPECPSNNNSWKDHFLQQASVTAHE